MGSLTFYLITALIFSCVSYIIYIENTVFAAFSLIMVYIFSVFILVSLNVDFLALLVLVIYVGAITVLVLFVIMMLNLKEPIRKINSQILPIGLIITLTFVYLILNIIEKDLPVLLNINDLFYLTELEYFQTIIKGGNWLTQRGSALCNFSVIREILNFDQKSDIYTIGSILYTYYYYHFLIGGILLLIGLIGPISLVLTNKTESTQQNTASHTLHTFQLNAEKAKKQTPYQQFSRRSKNAIVAVKFN